MLVLPSVLTLNQATACLAMLEQGLRAQTQAEVVADASALQQFDSSALAVLLACRRVCLADGKTFRVHGLSPRLAQLAGLYGVAGLLGASD
jgi:phospholipid transport system transporter-binding protein